jgi:hypothetical protein
MPSVQEELVAPPMEHPVPMVEIPIFAAAHPIAHQSEVRQ